MKKSKMIGVLSVMSVSLCAFALGMGVNGAKADAENGAEAAKDFYMENGASVRIDDKAGVRFSTHISESRYNAVKETAGDKEVKLVTIVNRADLGATHGAAKAMEFEYNLAGVSAKDGEYTVIARVTYSALEESLLLNAASVELEAKTYIVVGDDWEKATEAESNDNVRSMRSVAYAALTAGTVDKADVEKYLGSVQEETKASALLYTNAKAIDVSELTATYGDYTAAYIGAKKIGDVKNGKIDLAEAYNGTAETITLMDSANNVVTAPLKYAGDLSAEIKSHKYGSLAAMENGTVITLEKDGKQTTATVEGGKITAANLPAGTYSVKTNNYLNGELKITAGAKNESALTLEYDAFATTSGMEGWGSVRDFSKQNDGKITLNNDMQFIFSRKTFNKVAFSVVLQKDWNSNGGNGTQGVIFRFKDGDEYKGIAAMQTEGEKFLRNDGQADYGKYWAKQGVGLNGSLDLAEGGNWDELVNFTNRTDFKNALNAGTLKLTVLRDGAVFYAYLNGECVGFKRYAAKYADMECEAGFYYFGFKGSTTREWNFEVTEDTAAYNTALEKTGSNEMHYYNNVNLTGDVWQAMKVKVNAGYKGEVRIGFTAEHNGVDSNGNAKKGYVKSVLYQNSNWSIQETDSWNGTNLPQEYINALTGEGLYLAYHRDAATGYVKVYAGATKAALESAIKNGTALYTFTAEPELKKKEITKVGVHFFVDKDGGYTASATGYSYGATSEAVLAKLV